MRYFFLMLLLTGLAVTAATDYRLGEDYTIRFSTAKAEGTFSDLRGRVSFDPTDLAASNMDVSVATATIRTGNAAKDRHARGKRWLDADQYPRIGFQSHAFEAGPEGYRVRGRLSIKGHSQPVTIPFTFDGRTFAGAITVDRREYGIEGPFLFGGLVGNDVRVELRVPVKE